VENLSASLDTTLHMLLVIAIGKKLLGGTGKNAQLLDQINQLVFKLFLPLMIFQNIYTTDIRVVFDGKLLLYLLAVICIVWLFLLWHTPRWIHDRKTCGAFIQGTVRSNTIVFGMPVISSLYPDYDLGCPTLLTAIVTVVFNVVGAITLEIYRGNCVDIRKMMRNLLKNPVLIASVTAISLVLLQVSLPSFVWKTVDVMAAMGSPMGLLLIGANLQINLGKSPKTLMVSMVLRLVVIPAIALCGAVFLGWHGMELCTVLIIMAAPTSVSAYSMARAMESDSEFTAYQVGVSSILGTGTVFLWCALLETMKLL